MGNRLIRKLLSGFESPEEIFTADSGRLGKTAGVGSVTAGNIAAFDRWDEVDEILHESTRHGTSLLAVSDPDYPPLLREIYDAPPVLWIRGDPALLASPGLAVVGTRKFNLYGQNQAEIWSSRLAGSGLTVVSGLAYGIDTISHRAALGADGRTIAVLGSGINRIYPESNKGLAERIVESGGAVVSEFLPGTPPVPQNFPVRNRVVSGLSLGVLVIQSGMKGGSMITARTALDQNREVFVIPYNLEQKGGAGNNHLIQTGQGKLVQALDDILAEIAFTPDSIPAAGGGRNAKDYVLTKAQYQICSLLSGGGLQIDTLSEKTSRPAFDLFPLLLELEMEGVVVQQGGKYFRLNPDYSRHLDTAFSGGNK